jgi:hypothetical protein
MEVGVGKLWKYETHFLKTKHLEAYKNLGGGGGAIENKISNEPRNVKGRGIF